MPLSLWSGMASESSLVRFTVSAKSHEVLCCILLSRKRLKTNNPKILLTDSGGQECSIASVKPTPRITRDGRFHFFASTCSCLIV